MAAARALNMLSRFVSTSWVHAGSNSPRVALCTLRSATICRGASAPDRKRYISTGICRLEPFSRQRRSERGAVKADDRQKTEQSNSLIWEDYKRNHKGSIPPEKTRLKCKRGDKVCGNPCPICKRDIEINYTNTALLEQFICPYTGHILEATKTGLCRLQQKKLVAAVRKARDHGLLPFTIPRKLPEEEFRIPPWNRIDVT